jgi:hypothetical protein
MQALLGAAGSAWDAQTPGLISRAARLADGGRARVLLNWTSETARYGGELVPPLGARIVAE